MSGLEAQLNRLELQIYQYYPQLQSDCEAAKFERRQRLREQLRCSCPKVQLPQLDPHMSLTKIKYLLEKCQNLGVFDAIESDELPAHCPQLSESSDEEVRPSRSMRRNMRKRKACDSSHSRDSRRSRSNSDYGTPLSLYITIPHSIKPPDDKMEISIDLGRVDLSRRLLGGRVKALLGNNVPSSSLKEVGKNNSDSFGALAAVTADDSGTVALNTTSQEDELMSRLISEVLVEPTDVTETWRATTALDNINNKVNNYDVCVEQTPTSSQQPKKVRKQSKKQAKAPKEPSKKRGRKRKNAATVENDATATGLPKSDLAKYVELFSNSCNMAGCATPAHSSTMSQQLVTSTTQHLDDAEQQPVTYYLEGDWEHGGNCQLISTGSVPIEAPEEFNVTELVNYIDNVGNDAGNVIARVLDAPAVTAATAPVMTNLQVSMQQSQSQQLAPPPLRPAHSSEGVLDLSKKATTVPPHLFVVPGIRSASTATAAVYNDVDDCMPLDLSLKTTSVLARPASPPPSSAAIMKTTSQGPFTVDDYESFRAALDMPLIDIDDNMSAFMEMTSNATATILQNTGADEPASAMSQAGDIELTAHDNLAESTANAAKDYNLNQNELLDVESKEKLIDNDKREVVGTTNNSEAVADVTVYENGCTGDTEPHNVGNKLIDNEKKEVVETTNNSEVVETTNNSEAVADVTEYENGCTKPHNVSNKLIDNEKKEVVETTNNSEVVETTNNSEAVADVTEYENGCTDDTEPHNVSNKLIDNEKKEVVETTNNSEVVETTNNSEAVADVTEYENGCTDDTEPLNVSNNIGQNDTGNSSHDKPIDCTLQLTCNANITQQVGQIDNSVEYRSSNMQLDDDVICLDLSKREFDDIDREADNNTSCDMDIEPPSGLVSNNCVVDNSEKDRSNLCLNGNADNSVNEYNEESNVIGKPNNCSYSAVVFKSSDNNSSAMESRREDNTLIVAVGNGNVFTAADIDDEKETHCTAESAEEAFALPKSDDINYNMNAESTARSPSVGSVKSSSSSSSYVCNETERRKSNECNEQEAGNSKKEMEADKCQQNADEPNGSDKLSLDLLFVDVESLTPRKCFDHCDVYVTARQSGDPLNNEVNHAVGDLLPKVEQTELEKYDDESLEQTINNESCSSIDLIENMEYDNKLNVSLPMPQLTLMEHSSEEFTSMHLEHDCESSDSVLVSLESIEKADVKEEHEEIDLTTTVTGLKASEAEDCKCNGHTSAPPIDLTKDSSVESIVAAANTSTRLTDATLESCEQVVDIKIEKREQAMDASVDTKQPLGISKNNQQSPEHASSPQSSSAKSNFLLTLKNEADFFPSLSVLELESQLDDVCLDFEGELDDDALSLATSCFNSPDEDRFADVADEEFAQQPNTMQLDKTMEKADMVSPVGDEMRTEPKNNANAIHFSTNTSISNTKVVTSVTDGLRKFKIPKLTASSIAENSTAPAATISAPPPMVVLPPSTTITSQEIMTTRPMVTLEKVTRTVQNVCAVPPLPLQPAALIAATAAAVNTTPVPLHIRDMLQMPLPLPPPPKLFAANVVACKEYFLDDADSEGDVDGADNTAHLSRGLLAGTGGEGLNYGPSTLEVAQTFGVTCLPFLVDECFSLAACPLSHNYRDAVVVQNFLDTLSEPNLSVTYKFMYAHERLFRRYFVAFCKVYARRNNRDKLLNMVYDCERYDEGANSLRMLFYSLGMCGFSKVNACRQILSRSHVRSRPMINALVSIIMETDWTMFCDYIERFTEAPGYHFRIDVLNQMAPTVLRANNTRLAAVFFKCLVNLEPEDVTLLQHSPAVLQLLELMKSGQMCG